MVGLCARWRGKFRGFVSSACAAASTPSPPRDPAGFVVPPRFEGSVEMCVGEPLAGEGDEAGCGDGASTAAAAAATAPVRDIRRYKCDFCSVIRSKKILIRAHMLEHHKDEVDGLEDYQDGDVARKVVIHECESVA
ncbi:hypothetical protein PR202_ga11076 [Eleusine coracana subsp. coracana]|uniref:C2H2-type domain-containing protein n=1 Tax=Eleusine coracana subsp. coracana TaxID=191504 RepID=A0AAV5C8R3_ELECO|nr:hypothetical protein PR202_ga11076 [Eleusine coracana subsp. coracana]